MKSTEFDLEPLMATRRRVHHSPSSLSAAFNVCVTISRFLDLVIMAVSSAYLQIIVPSEIGISLVYMLNSVGDRIDP